MKTLLRSKLVLATAVLTTMGAITFACQGFLDVPTQATLDEAALATRSGVEGSLIAAYRSLDCSSSSAGSWGCAASNWVWGSVPSGDAYKGSNLGDQQPINSIETYLWSVSEADDYINQKWSQVFEGVSRANATLRLLDKVQTENPSAVSAADADGIRGEAIFLRAHYHFEAYRMWGSNTEGGTGGIPYYRQNDVDYRQTNVGVDAIANLIADLDSAIALLPATPRGLDRGRATSWTATAYKGRVQAYGAAATSAMWAAALTTLRSVQASGTYALESSFDRVWTGRVRNGPETIFAFQASAGDGEPSGWNSNWGERLNFPHSGSYFGCCGFHQPSFNLVNFFQVNGSGLPLALAGAAWNSPTPDTNFAAGVVRAVDPRVDWTVGRDNVPYKDYAVHNRSWIRDASYSGPYSPKKHIHEKSTVGTTEHDQGWVPTQTNNVNVHLFRYADMLLLLAEAEVEAGGAAGLTNALTIVNQIRARASQTAQGCGSQDSTVLNRYPSCAGNNTLAEPLIQGAVYDSLIMPWGLYRIGQYTAFATQAEARQAVRFERRLELAMEGQRFFDLRRWGGSDTAIANYVATERNRVPYLATATTYTLPKYLRYPIPSIQFDLSVVDTTHRLVQNPGW